MAIKKPLVLYGATIGQIQAGDVLDVQALDNNLTNGESGSVVAGAPVYISAATTFKKAQANAAGTVSVYGLVATEPSIATATVGAVVTGGVFSLTTAEWDAVTGQTGGLTPNATYYLDPTTAGKLTTTAPSLAGQYIAPIGVASSTTAMKVNITTTVLL